jgi:lysophospholipase L1-like esterase
VTSSGVTHAVLAVGANDFHPTGSAYINIYNNWWSTNQVNSYVASILTNIETAMVTVKTTDVRLVALNLLDYGKTPAVYGSVFYSNGTNRERVAAAIEKVNNGLRTLAQKYQVPLVDAFRFQETLFGSNTNLHQYAYIGNVTIKLQEGDTDPINNPNHTAAFVEDEAHPHTTIQGLFANAVLIAFQLGHDVNIAPFSEQEILAHAGLTYGGSDTLAAQIGNYNDYIVLPVRPKVTSFTVVGGLPQLRFSTVSNQFYRVERTDTLKPPAWTTLTNNVPGTGGSVLVTDPSATTLPQRFYRVRQLP